MTSTIHADKIMNSSGDQDSGLDLQTNDQVKLKTANTDRITVTDATTTVANDLAAATIKTATVKHTGGTTAMTIDSSGRILTPGRPVWWVNGNQNTNVANTASGQWEIYKFQATTIDTESAYNASTGKYTVPITGVYHIDALLLIQGLNSNSTYYTDFAVAVNGSLKTQINRRFNAYGRAEHVWLSGLVQATAGQAIDINLRVENHSNQVSYDCGTCSTFQGYLVG